MNAAIHTILPPPSEGFHSPDNGGTEGGVKTIEGLGVGGLDSLCSIYAHAKDTFGEYFDRETGEVIRQMSIREFLLTDRWQPQVMRLHELIAQYGVKAKKMEEYQNIKRSLPGATLSGVFGEHRRTAECIGRTGYIALDIDTGDNPGITDFSEVFDALCQRDEVEVVMHSCSGMGYLALVRLAYPDHIKEQFNALAFEYRKKLHINLDRACSDITRLRFATWDEKPFVRPADDVIPYMGMLADKNPTIKQIRPQTQRTYSNTDINSDIERAERMVRQIEYRGIDITGHYADCLLIGASLANLGAVGLDLWKRVCALRSPAFHDHFITNAEIERAWRWIGTPKKTTIGTFFHACTEHGLELR